MKHQVRWWLATFVAFLGLALTASAHPGDGIIVDKDGAIYFVARNPLHDTSHHACIYRLKKGESKPEAFYTSTHFSSNIFIVLGEDRQLYGAESNYLGERNGKDTFTTRMYRFDKLGNRTEVLGPRSGRSPYGGPAYLVDSKGTIFFAHESSIWKREPDGEDTLVFRRDKATDPALKTKIFNLAWGPNQEIYILYVDRVEIRNAEGHLRTFCKDLPNLPFDIEVDPEGNVYLPDWRSRTVMKVTDQGKKSTLMTSKEPWGAEGVALMGQDLIVLEFTGPPSPKIIPRLSRITSEGVSTLFSF